MKRIWIFAAVVCLVFSTAAGLYLYRASILPPPERSAPPTGSAPPPEANSAQAQPPAVAPRRTLSGAVPAGPLLVIEAKDFGSLLREWNDSKESTLWEGSDADDVFSRSRLFRGLEKVHDELTDAAAIQVDEALLNEAAGGRSILALYDIGKMELLYIAELPLARIMENELWQTRAHFESRSVGARPFFVRKDAKSGRVVAFAATDRYLILGTREDLVANALELVAGETSPSVEQEDWFRNAHAAAAKPGDLRMTLNMEKIAVAPLFRSFWIQQNITEMRGYAAAVSDLYRSESEYREERVLLPRLERKVPKVAKVPPDTPSGDITSQGEQAVADLVARLPRKYGVYRALANPKPEYCLAILQSKLLSPRVEEPADQKQAPTVTLTSGAAGTSSDLETRIDIAPATDTSEAHASDALEQLIDQASPMAMLWMHATRKNSKGPWVNISTGVVVVGSADWDDQAVRAALEKAIRPGLTAAALGLAWHPRGPAGNEYFALDGLAPFVVAARGPRLFLANDEPTMLALLESDSSVKAGQAIEKTAPAIYAAGFRHESEQKNLVALTSVLKRSAPATKTSQYIPEDIPDFFSGTIASLGKTLEDVTSESVVVRRYQNKVTQTVIYHWSQ